MTTGGFWNICTFPALFQTPASPCAPCLTNDITDFANQLLPFRPWKNYLQLTGRTLQTPCPWPRPPWGSSGPVSALATAATGTHQDLPPPQANVGLLSESCPSPPHIRLGPAAGSHWASPPPWKLPRDPAPPTSPSQWGWLSEVSHAWLITKYHK